MTAKITTTQRQKPAVNRLLQCRETTLHGNEWNGDGDTLKREKKKRIGSLLSIVMMTNDGERQQTNSYDRRLGETRDGRSENHGRTSSSNRFMCSIPLFTCEKKNRRLFIYSRSHKKYFHHKIPMRLLAKMSRPCDEWKHAITDMTQRDCRQHGASKTWRKLEN